MDTVVNNLIVKPTIHSADSLVGQVGALGSDVAADMKDLGHMVVQPVVDMATKGKTPTMPQNQPPKVNDKTATMDMFGKTALCLFSSTVVYAIADIRTLIRNHKDQMVGDPEQLQQLLTLPVKDIEVMKIIMQNLQLLQEKMKKGEIDFYISAVLRYRKDLMNQTNQELSASERENTMTTASAAAVVAAAERDGTMMHDDETTTTTTTAARPPPLARTTRRRSMMVEMQQQQQQQQARIPNTLEVFDDENSQKELVYGIAVNRSQQQINITFRGSVTSKDWFVDGKFFLTNVPNPLWTLQQQHSNHDGTNHHHHHHHHHGGLNLKFSIPQNRCIGIHAGFYEYLFASRSKTEDTSKYRQILNRLTALYEKEESLRSFSINVTGHSLGGALATLFSFYLILEPDFIVEHLPVTCISFASPKPGNIQLARAFQELELQKQVICLRVANYRDLITERPDRLTCWTFCLQDAIFRHVGIELLLYPETTKKTGSDGKRYRIHYPRVRRSRVSQFSDDFLSSLVNTIYCTTSVTCGCCIHDYMKWHSCDEYLSRVEQIENALESVPMQELHNRYHTVVAEESDIFRLPNLTGGSARKEEE